MLLALVAGLLGLLSASRTWVTADVTDALAGRLQLRLSGRQVAPVVPAVSVVLLAAGVSVLLARRLGRVVTGLVLVLAGAAGAAAAVSAARAPEAAVAAELARATGRSAVGPAGAGASVAVTPWPWLAVVAGLAAVVAGAFVVLRARRWAAPSDRFEVPAAAAEGRPAETTPPSADRPVSDGVAEATGAAGAAALGSAAGPAGATGVDSASGSAAADSTAEPADAWDALSRGEDPTR
ncbi:MAG TPA: Trp biosynthesis-associated membrane protein [Actinomycetales bacterium]|nr:Trp biosynthesis-associated membrane protein [Actinomycetales bacterium]